MDNRMRRMSVASVALLASFLWAAAAPGGQRAKSQPSVEASLDKPPVATVNAREHGVVGNGEADDTEALQAALDAGKKGEPCIRADGGRLVVSGCEFKRRK
jgi:polygalacturonase